MNYQESKIGPLKIERGDRWLTLRLATLRIEAGLMRERILGFSLRTRSFRLDAFHQEKSFFRKRSNPNERRFYLGACLGFCHLDFIIK